MSLNLRFGLLVTSFLLLLIVLHFTIKGKIPIKYSLVWLLSILILLSTAIVPNILVIISKLIGFVTMSNMIIGMILVLLLLITFTLTMIVSGQQRKINLLIQEISILKATINKK